MDNLTQFCKNRKGKILIRSVIYFLVIIVVLSISITGCHQQTFPIPETNLQPSVNSTNEIPTISPSPIELSPQILRATTIPSKIPSKTPYPPISSTGPYLLYQKENTLIILDKDGRGRRLINLPEGAVIRDLQKAVSPNGKWLAFHSPIHDLDHNGGIPENLQLNLLSLENGNISTITPLISAQQESSKQGYVDGDIQSLDWSPDGSKLAFAGLLDGPAIDLYIYDLGTKEIHRVTNDQFNLNNIDWSPNGNWIWYEKIDPTEMFPVESFGVARVNGSEIEKPKILSKGPWYQADFWVSNNEYFLHSTCDGCDIFDLRYINVDTGQIHKLWQRAVGSYAVDPEEKLLAVSAWPETNENGIYLVDWNGKGSRISDDVYKDLVFRGGKSIRFLGFGWDKVTGITENGSLMTISSKPFSSASISPDRRWYLLYESHTSPVEGSGMDLYSESDQYVRTITDKKGEPIWRPDSEGFFYMDGLNLYYVSMPDGNPVLIDSCESKNCKYWLTKENFFWLLQ